MGMSGAFNNADFSGMDGRTDLEIADVVHKSYVSVDEAGTEAAAATGVIMTATSMPAEPVKVTIDHPFIFLLRRSSWYAWTQAMTVWATSRCASRRRPTISSSATCAGRPRRGGWR